MHLDATVCDSLVKCLFSTSVEKVPFQSSLQYGASCKHQSINAYDMIKSCSHLISAPSFLLFHVLWLAEDRCIASYCTTLWMDFSCGALILQAIKRCMLFRGTERNQRGIFRKMLKRGTIVSTTEINMVADLWKALVGYSPLLLLANYSVHYMNMILKV